LVGETVRLRDLWNEKDITEEELQSLRLNGNHFALIGVF